MTLGNLVKWPAKLDEFFERNDSPLALVLSSRQDWPSVDFFEIFNKLQFKVCSGKEINPCVRDNCVMPDSGLRFEERLVFDKHSSCWLVAFCAQVFVI